MLRRTVLTAMLAASVAAAGDGTKKTENLRKIEPWFKAVSTSG